MLDVYDIKVTATGVAYDAGTKTEGETFTVLFRTYGRVKTTASTGRQEVGGRTAAAVTRELHIPATSSAVPVGAVAVPVSIHETSDPTLATATLRVEGPAPGSQTTARRLEVTEVIT